MTRVYVAAYRVVKRRTKNGFSLTEILVVMSIMVVLMVMGVSLFRNMGRGESQQAVRSLLLAGLNNAHTRALSSGEPVAMVMTPYDTGREGQLGRSFTLFEVREDDVTGEFVAEKQLRRWALLPGRFIFSKDLTVSGEGQNAFDQPAVVSIEVSDGRSPNKTTVEMPAIIFGGTGSVVWPAGDGELELHAMEGAVVNGQVTAVGEASSDWRKREVIVIGRQTGRARFLQTQ